jgi:hypothetical protein
MGSDKKYRTTQGFAFLQPRQNQLTNSIFFALVTISEGVPAVKGAFKETDIN